MILTEYDVKILAKITDPEDSLKGLSKMTGITVQELIDKTGYSDKKVRVTLKRFLDEEMIDYGIAKGRTKTYYIMPKGLEELKSLYEVIMEDDE